MAKVKDFKWNGDLVIANGDFVIDFSDLQHIQDLVESSPGHWKEFPSVGVGAIAYLNGRDFGGFQTKVTDQLLQDGYTDNLQVEKDENGKQIVYGERPQ